MVITGMGNPERGQTGPRLAERGGGVSPGGRSVINGLRLSGWSPSLVSARQVTCGHFSLSLAPMCQERGRLCSRALQGCDHPRPFRIHPLDEKITC